MIYIQNENQEPERILPFTAPEIFLLTFAYGLAVPVFAEYLIISIAETLSS